MLAYHDDYKVLLMGAIHKIIMVPLLYKMVMQLATLDFAATNAILCKNIHELTQYAITFGRDVDEIISYIDINYSQLKALGEVMADAVEHILKAFRNGVKENDFKIYFKKETDDYWDEMAEMKNILVEALLAKAKTKYDLLKAQGTWGATSKKMKNFIALCA